MRLRILAVSLLQILAAVGVFAEDRFETLVIGGTTYSNVCILSRTSSDIFFTHSMGLSNVKLRDLSDRVRSKVSVTAHEESENRPIPHLEPIELEVDPRVKEMQLKLGSEIESRLQGTARNVVLVFLGVIALVYLFFCYCCMLICDKAGSPSRFLVWIPGLQLSPLFRAAGLPRWALSALFAPQIFSGMTPYLLPDDLSVNSSKMIAFMAWGAASVLISLITAVIFCVKLSRVCNKSGWFALLLLFPLTCPFAFIYLAFCDRETEESASNPGFVSFQQEPVAK